MKKSHLVIALMCLLTVVSQASAQRLKRTDGPAADGSTSGADYQAPQAQANAGAGLPLRGYGSTGSSDVQPNATNEPVQSFAAPPQSFGQQPQSFGQQPSPSYAAPPQSFAPPAASVMNVRANAGDEGADVRQRTAVRIQSAPILGVTQKDLQMLGRHDIVLLIDKSSSMKERDCPGGLSRWEWCREQTMNLSRATSSTLPKGLSVVLFSTGTHVFASVNVNDIPRIFSMYSPGGFTNESGALDRTFTDYFNRREQAHGKVKPLLIAVITDGLPSNPQGVRDVIIDASHNVRPDEMKMTFLQVGSDPKGMYFVKEMDQQLVGEGAAFDMVSSRTFPELIRAGGLTKALVDCLSEHESR